MSSSVADGIVESMDKCFLVSPSTSYHTGFGGTAEYNNHSHFSPLGFKVR